MNTALTRFRPLIPAGGVGSRLWPLSRAQAPKFLLDLTDSGKSLLRDTYDRLIDLSNGSVMVVTGTSHANAVTQQIPELRASDLVLEPSPKDSAAAIGLACAIIHEREPDAIIGSFAADHVINPVDEFQRVVTEAVITAASGKIVTIGITPTEPSSAFGYIHASESLGIEGAPNAHAVDTFVRLLAPFLPFATEEVWSWYREGSVHTAPWPVVADLAGVEGDPSVLEAASSALIALRRVKSEAKVSPRVFLLLGTPPAPATSIKPPRPKVVLMPTRTRSSLARLTSRRRTLLPKLTTSRRLLKKLLTPVRTGLGVTLR